jgi:hypothetical protein
MTESKFSLNGSLDRYSYSIANYSGGHASAPSNQFEMDVGISASPPFNHSEPSNSTMDNYLIGDSLLPNETYESLFEVPTGVTALLSLFYGSISVMAVVGNSLVMWIVATSRRMQNVTNCFIANLALADIVIGLFAIPFQVCTNAFLLLSVASCCAYPYRLFIVPSIATVFYILNF